MPIELFTTQPVSQSAAPCEADGCWMAAPMQEEDCRHLDCGCQACGVLRWLLVWVCAACGWLELPVRVWLSLVVVSAFLAGLCVCERRCVTVGVL